MREEQEELEKKEKRAQKGHGKGSVSDLMRGKSLVPE